MILGKVVGSVVSTIKHDCYANRKLLLVKPVSPKLELRKGVQVAVDLVGAGIDDVVLLASEGRAAQELLELSCRMPVRSIVVGIVDHILSEEV